MPLTFRIFFTFSLKKGNSEFEQLLSTGVVLQEFDVQNSQNEIAHTALQWSALAVASQEMQFDFENGFVVLPLSFFDQVVGIIIAQKKDLKVDDYQKMVSESTALLTSLRRVVMSGRLSHLQTMSRAS